MLSTWLSARGAWRRLLAATSPLWLLLGCLTSSEDAETSSATAPAPDWDCGGDCSCIRAVSAGQGRSCLIRGPEGTVWCWGSNLDGVLGDGTLTDHIEPARVVGLSGVVDVQSASYFSCALDGQGELWCWGRLWQGQVGDRKTSNSQPQRLDLGEKVQRFGLGAQHGCAVLQSGIVKCFGKAGRHSGRLSGVELEDGTLLEDVAWVSAGTQNSCAVTQDGKVYCWGENNNGEFADGSKEGSSRARPSGYPQARQTTGGSYRSCALDTESRVWCAGWTGTQVWQLGLSPTAMEIAGVVSQIVAGQQHDLAIDSQAQLWAWGLNNGGQLGDGTTEHRGTPGKVERLGPVASASASNNHSCALEVSGKLWCWGDNMDGQLGDGSRLARHLPVPVRFSCATP